MELKLDILKKSGTCVIENNNNGMVCVFSVDTDDFLMILVSEMSVEDYEVLDYFSRDDLEDFFIENDIDILPTFWNRINNEE